MKRLLLVAAAALAGISLFLLTSASANTELFATSYPYLLALNGAMVVVLGALVGVQLRQQILQVELGAGGSVAALSSSNALALTLGNF